MSAPSPPDHPDPSGENQRTDDERRRPHDTRPRTFLLGRCLSNFGCILSGVLGRLRAGRQTRAVPRLSTVTPVPLAFGVGVRRSSLAMPVIVPVVAVVVMAVVMMVVPVVIVPAVSMVIVPVTVVIVSIPGVIMPVVIMSDMVVPVIMPVIMVVVIVSMSTMDMPGIMAMSIRGIRTRFPRTRPEVTV